MSKAVDRPTNVKAGVAPNRTGDPQATINYAIDIGWAAPGGPEIGRPMGKDQAVAMQLGDTAFTIPRAEADNLLRLEQHLHAIAVR